MPLGSVALFAKNRAVAMSSVRDCNGNPFCPYRIFKKLGTLWAKRLQCKARQQGL